MSEEPAKKNHWQQLASEIGAQPSADAGTTNEQIGQPSIDSQMPVEVELVVAKSPLPESRPADWGSLAAALGAAAPPPSPPVIQSAGEPSIGQPSADYIDLPPGPARVGDVRVESQDVVAAAADLVEETFADSAAETFEPRPCRVPHGRPSDDGSEARPENFAASMDSIETAVEFVQETANSDSDAESAGNAVQEVAVGATTADTQDDQDGPKRRRRRRRGRRGASARRGAPEDKSAASNTASADATADEAAHDVESDDNDDDDDDDDMSRNDAGDDVDSPSAERATGHRNIPTWQEAIGLVISANMEARQRSPKGDGPGSRGGRGRGRGGQGGRGRPAGGRKGDNRK